MADNEYIYNHYIRINYEEDKESTSNNVDKNVFNVIGDDILSWFKFSIYYKYFSKNKDCICL